MICPNFTLDRPIMRFITSYTDYKAEHYPIKYVYYTLACTNFVRCARSSIPNMEIINKKYLIKTKNSKMIIFMSGDILSFSTNKG